MSTQKIAVVTGGNKGIGYAIVKGLCEKFQGKVYLTARDVSRGQSAVAKLKDLGLNPSFHQLDINDESSIKKFKNYLAEKYGGLDLLINNAAIVFGENAPEPLSEQAKIIIDVNYFANLRVCEILFPILRNNARVINLTSSVGHLSWVPSAELRAKFNDPQLTIPQLNKLMQQFVQDVKVNKHIETGWTNCPNHAYAVSKVGISALTKIQQRELEKEVPNRNISVSSVHPGYVDTDLTEHKGPWTIEQGARAPLWAALEAPHLKGEFVWSNATAIPWDSEKTPSLH